MQKYLFLAACVISFYPASYLTGRGFQDSGWKPVNYQSWTVKTLIKDDNFNIENSPGISLLEEKEPIVGKGEKPVLSRAPCHDKYYADEKGNLFKDSCKNNQGNPHDKK